MRKSWILAVLLAGCATEAPERVVEERAFSGNAPRGEAMLQRTMVTMHAAARAEVNQPVLAWDEMLAADALAYAREMARTGRFAHAPQARHSPVQGENLWTGTRGAYRYDEMIRHWIDERRYFVNRPIPNVSTTGNFADVAHYTQMVWSRTTRFGCAIAANAKDDFVVCRYLPAGNVVGQTTLP